MEHLLPNAVDAALPWQERLDKIVKMMREVSRQTDPQAMVRTYSARVRELTPTDRLVSLSRRGLGRPEFRITRSSMWKDDVNPWRERDRLPLLRGGFLAELLYGDEPRLIDDLQVSPDDPAYEYLAGMRSLVSIPMYDHGEALNMTLLMRREPGAFDPERFPEMIWQGNLFGRATHNLVLTAELKRAYDAVDREMRSVAQIQRALLPSELPRIATLDLAAHYETSTASGGDYYDFFELPDDRWGILIADVAGHGTPAAVLMAITHAIMHLHPGAPESPARVLEFLNLTLCTHYTNRTVTFVTAFYGVYDARTRALRYASAGHNPPRLKRCDDGSMGAFDRVNGLPLGVVSEATYHEAVHPLRVGDQIIFYTDGITEAFNSRGEMFGTERLDAVLGACRPYAQALIDAVLEELRVFSNGRPADDDRTILVAKVR